MLNLKLNKKVIVNGLIAMQLLTTVSSITVARADGPTAEETLIAQVYQIEGSGLSQEKAQTQVLSAVQDYDKTAPKEDREERLSAALVSMNLYSSSQAQSLFQDVSASADKLSNQNFSNEEQAAQATKTEIVSILSSHPANGAQFSGCSTSFQITAGVLGIGGALAMAGDLVHAYNVPLADRAPDADGGQGTRGPVDQSVMYGGLIAMSVGIIMTIVAVNSDCGTN